MCHYWLRCAVNHQQESQAHGFHSYSPAGLSRSGSPGHSVLWHAGKGGLLCGQQNLGAQVAFHLWKFGGA